MAFSDFQTYKCIGKKEDLKIRIKTSGDRNSIFGLN